MKQSFKKGDAQWGYSKEQINKLKLALENPENKDQIIEELAAEKGVRINSVILQLRKLRKNAVSIPKKGKSPKKISVKTNEGEIVGNITSLDINMRNKKITIKYSY